MNRNLIAKLLIVGVICLMLTGVGFAQTTLTDAMPTPFDHFTIPYATSANEHSNIVARFQSLIRDLPEYLGRLVNDRKSTVDHVPAVPAIASTDEIGPQLSSDTDEAPANVLWFDHLSQVIQTWQANHTEPVDNPLLTLSDILFNLERLIE